MAYSDGTFTSAVQNGPKQIFYPFLNAATKDTTTKGTIRNYVVLPNSYSPAAALSTDPDDATQYLIEETDPQIEAGVARYQRVYCKVPQQQIEPGTITLSKPTIPGNEAFPRNFGNYIIVQPDTTLEKYDAYQRAAVTSDTGVPTFYPSGGTFTVTLDSNTTSAINFLSNASTVQSALNGLTTVQNRGNVTVSGTYNSSTGYDITFANVATATMNVSSIVVSANSSLTSSVTASNNGYSQAFEFKQVTGTLSNTSASLNVASLTVSPGGGSVVQTVQYLSSVGLPRSWNLGYVVTSNYSITGGTFTVSVLGGTTAAINWSNNASTLQTSLESAFNNVSAITDLGPFTVTNVYVYPSGSADFRLNVGSGKIKSGTFAITLLGGTTSALNYNSNVSVIESALNSISNVQTRGNVIVTSSSGTATILNTDNTVAAFSVGFSNNTFSSNASSLTPSGATISIVKTDGTIGRTQRMTFTGSAATRTLFAVGHGIDAGETIFVRSSSTVYPNIDSSRVTVIDANTVQLAVFSSDSWSNVATITEVGPRNKQNYEPGSVIIRSKTTTDFYLPGVTAGITTADDIPIPVDESGTAAFLEGVFSGQSAINVRVGELRPWRGPILLVDRTSVAASDV